MRRDSPIYTFYTIIAGSLCALVYTNLAKIPSEEAMPVFMLAMALGVVVGEIIERSQNKTKAR